MTGIPGLLGVLVGIVLSVPTIWIIFLKLRPYLRSGGSAGSTNALVLYVAGLPALWIGGPVVATTQPVVPLTLPPTDVLAYLSVIVVLNIIPLAAIFVVAFVPDLSQSIRVFRSKEAT